MRQVLRLPVYRRLLLAYGLTQVAWIVVEVALAILVYRRTGSAIGAAAFFLCAQFVPAFFAPPVVARLDRRSPRKVLPSLYIAEALLFLALALLVGHIAVGFVLGLALLDGIVSLVVRSLARTATVEVTAPVGLLREGNALTNTVFSITLLAGPALGGLLVAAASVRVSLLVGAGMVVLIALALVTARGLPHAVPDDSPAKGRVGAALHYVRDQPAIRALLALQAAALVFFTMSIPVELVLAQHTLHAGAGGYGASCGLGRRLDRRQHHLRALASAKLGDADWAWCWFVGIGVCRDGNRSLHRCRGGRRRGRRSRKRGLLGRCAYRPSGAGQARLDGPGYEPERVAVPGLSWCGNSGRRRFGAVGQRPICLCGRGRRRAADRGWGVDPHPSGRGNHWS